jgi:hypothetical protein
MRTTSTKTAKGTETAKTTESTATTADDDPFEGPQIMTRRRLIDC